MEEHEHEILYCCLGELITQVLEYATLACPDITQEQAEALYELLQIHLEESWELPDEVDKLRLDS